MYEICGGILFRSTRQCIVAAEKECRVLFSRTEKLYFNCGVEKMQEAVSRKEMSGKHLLSSRTLCSPTLFSALRPYLKKSVSCSGHVARELLKRDSFEEARSLIQILNS
jgi:hypothetical protein